MKSRIYYQLAEDFAYDDTLKAKELLTKGKQYAGGNKYLEALAVFYKAQLLYETNKTEAEKVYLQAGHLLTSFNRKEAYYFRARSWYNYGALRQLADDSKTMLDVLIKKSIPLSKKSENKAYLAFNYGAVGLIFSNKLQYGKAAYYYAEALKLLETHSNKSSSEIFIYIDAARNYLYMGQLSLAKKIMDKTRNKIIPNTALELNMLLNEGIYYNESKQYKLALSKLSESRKIAQKLKDTYLEETIMFQQYRSLDFSGNHKKAKDLLLAAMESPTIPYTGNKQTVYYNLANSYHKLGKQDSAFFWMKEYSDVKDKFFDTKFSEQISEMEAKFRNEENRLKIIELKAANQQAAFKIKQNQLYGWLFGISCIIIALLAAVIYIFQRKNKADMARKEQILVTNAIIRGQEEERSRIARDLHDGLGGSLAAIKMGLSTFINRQQGDIQNSPLHGIQQQVDHSAMEIRRIANNMMPEMLLQLGLKAALDDLCNTFNSESLHIELHYFVETLHRQHQLTVYRIIQELLTNTVKHAEANSVFVQCSQEGHILFLTFEDDGRGFEIQQSRVSGFGLQNIRARVAHMDGKMDIISGGLHKGTSIHLELTISHEI
jgi:signal transduction histidine kinase